MISDRKRSARKKAGLTGEYTDYKLEVKPPGLDYIKSPVKPCKSKYYI